VIPTGTGHRQPITRNLGLPAFFIVVLACRATHVPEGAGTAVFQQTARSLREGHGALLHSVRSRRAEAALDVQDQITRASSSNATVTRRFCGASTARS
jgi:hypothetical protein